jgi:hypothetical protein
MGQSEVFEADNGDVEEVHGTKADHHQLRRPVTRGRVDPPD